MVWLASSTPCNAHTTSVPISAFVQLPSTHPVISAFEGYMDHEDLTSPVSSQMLPQLQSSTQGEHTS